MSEPALSLREAADLVGVTPATLKRWGDTGVIPDHDANDGWTPVAVAHARMVHRLRERGHTLDELRQAGEEGRLATSFVEDLLTTATREEVDFEDAADEAGLEPELVERIWSTLGFAPRRPEKVSREDVQALQYVASVLEAGFPLVAFLQLLRVYGQSLARIADAETRLFHIYVHEPLMRQGVPGLQMAEEMEDLAGDLLPLASPIVLITRASSGSVCSTDSTKRSTASSACSSPSSSVSRV